MNWNNLQTFIVVAELGSLARASKYLKLNATTISRRLSALETELDSALFRRDHGQFTLTAKGNEVFDRAKVMADAAQSLKNNLKDSVNTLTGLVRLTAVESIIVNCLIPDLASFRERFPGICLELLGIDSNLSFARREVDIAIRLARPQVGNVVTRKLADVGFAAYMSKKFIENDQPNFKTLDWVTYDQELMHLPECRWVVKQLNGRHPALMTTNAEAMVKVMRKNCIAGVLPCYRGDREKKFQRISGPKPIITREAWLLIHQFVRENLRIRRTTEWVINSFESRRRYLSGIQ